MEQMKTTMTEVCASRAGGLQRTSISSRPELNRERLESWKEIAVYVDREVRTVQRWGKHENMPIRRHFHRKACTVYAFKSEIDAWLGRRSQNFSEPRALRRHLKQSPDGLDLSSQEMGQIFALFRLWLAIIERSSNFADCTGVETTAAQSSNESQLPGTTLWR